MNNKKGNKHTNAQTSGNDNGHLQIKKSHPVKAGSLKERDHRIFDPMKYMLKLSNYRKISLANGQVRFEKSEACYLPVAARVARFRKKTGKPRIKRSMKGFPGLIINR